MTLPAEAGRGHAAGLCARCRHHRIVESRRGSRFYLCELSAADARYAKYPSLPVLRCGGYEDVDSGRRGEGGADPE